jgi:hypothetical protein
VNEEFDDGTVVVPLLGTAMGAQFFGRSEAMSDHYHVAVIDAKLPLQLLESERVVDLVSCLLEREAAVFYDTRVYPDVDDRAH